MKSRAITSPCDKIRIPINEPTETKSQILEYLDAYHGECIQHIALELIFFHVGQFSTSRDHIYPGMMTLHPSGIPHGPHPKALQNAGEKRRTMTDEVAVMIDIREALEISKQAEAIEWADYVDS